MLNVENQKFFCIKGKGNPNDADFSERVGVLYSLAYAVRMMPKNGFTPNDYFEENNHEIKTLIHREIYLADARKVERDKLKTILKYRINSK